jgi:hypothetical protein
VSSESTVKVSSSLSACRDVKVSAQASEPIYKNKQKTVNSNFFTF